VHGLSLVDTTAFSFSREKEDEAVKRINSGSLRCIFDNGYPFDAGIQLYLLGSNNLVLDSLMPSLEWIEGAAEGTNGRVSATKRSIVEIPLDQDKLDRMEQASDLRIKALLNTVGTDSVHVRAEYKIDYRIVGNFNVNTLR